MGLPASGFAAGVALADGAALGAAEAVGAGVVIAGGGADSVDAAAAVSGGIGGAGGGTLSPPHALGNTATTAKETTRVTAVAVRMPRMYPRNAVEGNGTR